MIVRTLDMVSPEFEMLLIDKITLPKAFESPELPGYFE
jgi:hypothetical protein